jgi:nitronate monooxygenase
MTQHKIKSDSRTIPTDFTRLLGCSFPIIAGPMFLVSDPDLVSAVSEAGGIGAMPSLNWRSTAEFHQAIKEVKSRTSKPFAVNLIVNQANLRQSADLEVCVAEKVPMIITSLGNPKNTIQKMHPVGSKVFCDVTNLSYAKKVESLGADGVIAVSSGAGGHAGPTSSLVLIPYLRKHLSIPVIAAGGISTGQQLAAALLLGASAVQIGTLFIASHEAKVDQNYKNAILNAKPEDIVMTKKISGTPCSVIRTPYIDKVGTDVNWFEEYLYRNIKTKKYMKILRTYLGSVTLKKSVLAPTFKEVWSAGQSVGLIDEILPVAKIMENLVSEYFNAAQSFATRVSVAPPASS